MDRADDGGFAFGYCYLVIDESLILQFHSLYVWLPKSKMARIGPYCLLMPLSRHIGISLGQTCWPNKTRPLSKLIREKRIGRDA